MCCAVLGVAALAAAGRRSFENGCRCRRERFEPRTNVIRMTEPASCCSCCCCKCETAERPAAASLSCEAVEAFKQAQAERSRDGNRHSCGCCR